MRKAEINRKTRETDINIKIELNETGADGKPFKNASGVLPGAQIKKIVTVKNVSDNACWVRLAVNKAISLAEGVSTAPDLSLVSLDINREDWCERDGFYYYKHPLEAGQTTVPLFTTVSFDTAMDDSYKRGTAEITVRAQAVQYANNGASALNAVGWREE